MPTRFELSPFRPVGPRGRGRRCRGACHADVTLACGGARVALSGPPRPFSGETPSCPLRTRESLPFSRTGVGCNWALAPCPARVSPLGRGDPPEAHGHPTRERERGEGSARGARAVGGVEGAVGARWACAIGRVCGHASSVRRGVGGCGSRGGGAGAMSKRFARLTSRVMCVPSTSGKRTRTRAAITLMTVPRK